MEITSAVLAGAGPDGLWPLIAKSALPASGADIAMVMVPTSDPDWLATPAAVGERAETLLGLPVPVDGSLAGPAFVKGQPQLWDDMATDDRFSYPPARSLLAPFFGPGMCVPVVDSDGERLGVLGVAKVRGRPGFDDQDVAMLTSFAEQAVLAKQLDDHRAQAEQLRLLEERDRIARDLHDHVISEVFATGITLQGIAAAADVEPVAQLRRRLLSLVGRLDDVVAEIRTTISGLRPSPVPHQQSTGSMRQRLLDVVQNAGGPLGFAPSLHFNGPVELIGATLAGDVVAVVREALSNTARHAHATAVRVEVTASGAELAVRVADNGRGIGDTTHRGGLRNLRARAERHRGMLAVCSHPTGTTLTWIVPVTRPATRPATHSPELAAATGLGAGST
ncbi:hypothetical protein GTS_07450 [Gandjariella thermophila]|uniref:Histidine kinase n=1 Tax=Gandjariella thermophila TaxID=1931992 RepID=A0A4D4J1Y9_9PSEU|nr:hypothetical protein GTS_07450 [Gandjariella thermophila]